MNAIPLPKTISADVSKGTHGSFVIEPLYPGYGMTVGNALRRVLLSSLSGGAVTAIKFEGATHEFSALPYVKEDVVDILLNVKQIRFKMPTDEPVTLSINVKGAKKVTAGDIQTSGDIEVMNKDLVIATVTDDAGTFAAELTIGKGRGYVPVENREKEKMDIGMIAVDAIYTPIKNVNFTTQHVRVEQMTNYDRLLLDITTDGTINPTDALRQATQIMVEHFQFLHDHVTGTGEAVEVPAEAVTTSETAPEEPAEAPAKKTRKKKTDEA